MRAKLTGRQKVTYGIKKSALLKTYFDRSSMTIRYKLYAGQKGTGSLLATETCQWGLMTQRQALKRIETKIGKLCLLEDA